MAVLDNVVTCDVVGRFLFVVVQNAYLLFSELEAFGPCACPAGQYAPVTGSGPCVACPANSVSPAGAVAVTQCVFVCPAGQYEETRVLNPPESQRTYSSVNPGHDESLLDDLFDMQAWLPSTNVPGHYIDIDTGEPLQIIGIISQGLYVYIYIYMYIYMYIYIYKYVDV